jgi:hypothetical protein
MDSELCAIVTATPLAFVGVLLVAGFVVGLFVGRAIATDA